VRRTRGNIAKVLGKLTARGLLVDGLNLEDAARRLLVLIMGMAIQVMFDPEEWPAHQQHALVDRQLRALFRPDRAPANLAGERGREGAATRPYLVASE
jgi:hypothetical protein